MSPDPDPPPLPANLQQVVDEAVALATGSFQEAARAVLSRFTVALMLTLAQQGQQQDQPPPGPLPGGTPFPDWDK